MAKTKGKKPTKKVEKKKPAAASKAKGKAAQELTDEDLERVSGGVTFGTLAVSTTQTTKVVGVTEKWMPAGSGTGWFGGSTGGGFE